MPPSTNPIRIVDGLEFVDFETVHRWLAGSYWSPGVSREKVERGARYSSLVISALDGDRQVGYTRIVSDRASFAWVCDVFVDEEYRGLGIAKRMVRYALEHHEHQDLRRWVLATRDAHGIYRECGFIPLPLPERWMVIWKLAEPIDIG